MHLQHTFLYISLPPLHEFDVKFQSSTFWGAIIEIEKIRIQAAVAVFVSEIPFFMIWGIREA